MVTKVLMPKLGLTMTEGTIEESTSLNWPSSACVTWWIHLLCSTAKLLFAP